MNRVLTWAEFRTDLKTELGIQITEAQQDNFLLALANESLTQMAQSGKDLREFRIDNKWDIVDPDKIEITDTVFATIEQAYIYCLSDNGDFEYDITEQSGIVGPAHPAGPNSPNSYSVRTIDLDAAGPKTIFQFYPPHAGEDMEQKLHVIGTGFKLIADDTTRLYYFNLYPWLKTSIMERYAIKRNDDPNSLQAITNLANRTGTLGAGGTVDAGDSVNSPQPRK